MTSYDLSRRFFDWAFENPEKVTPNHVALYFFCIEHCNRLGWKNKFGLPTTMAKEAIGIKSYNTFIKIFNDLIDWGFITLLQKSTNQYSSNIIALSKNDKALNKALDKAMIKHVTKQGESTIQSNDSIIKHITEEQKTNNIEQEFNFVGALLDLGVDEKLASIWFDIRKSKNAMNSAAIFFSLKYQMEKSQRPFSECVEVAVSKGWADFKAEWLKDMPGLKPIQEKQYQWRHLTDISGGKNIYRGNKAKYDRDVLSYGETIILVSDGN